MNNNNHEFLNGVGPYRLFKFPVYNSICEVTQGARALIHNSIVRTPRFRHIEDDDCGEIRYEDPDSYYHPDIIADDNLILESVKERWETVKDTYSHTSGKVLLKEFETEEEIIDICFKLVKAEMALIVELWPTTLQDDAITAEEIGDDKEEAIFQQCRNYEKVRNEQEQIKSLVESNDIEGFARLTSNHILDKRLGGYGLRSEYSWEDVRSVYNLDKNQLKAFRSSKAYHNCLANKCIERVESWRSHASKSAHFVENQTPSEYYNQQIIKKAGAIGFVEPDYG